MKGNKYTIKVINYDTNESYVDFQVYSDDYSPKYRLWLFDRVNQVQKEIDESEMQYDVTIYGKTEPDAEFLTYTYTIYKKE